MNTVVGSAATKAAMFKTIGGWTTQFEIEGQKVGGVVDILPKDPRLVWHLEKVGGAKDKRVLELGALEGAHTKMLCEAGAREVISTEGLNDAFLRCLIVKEAFELSAAKFLFCDFNNYVENYQGDKFDFVSAAGVLYHQRNPVKLIRNLARITGTVIVWSQVANNKQPSNIEAVCEGYKGKLNNYKGTRLTSQSYCGGLQDEAFWFYPDQMLSCFKDFGFTNIEQQHSPSNINGDCLLFVASKNKI